MVIYDEMETVEKIKLMVRGIELEPHDPPGSEEEMHAQLVQYRIGDVHSPFVENREGLAIECAEFLDAVQTGKPTITSGVASYNVVRTCAAIDRSLKSGGDTVEVE